jgi:hypothetical protein
MAVLLLLSGASLQQHADLDCKVEPCDPVKVSCSLASVHSSDQPSRPNLPSLFADRCSSPDEHSFYQVLPVHACSGLQAHQKPLPLGLRIRHAQANAPPLCSRHPAAAQR